MTDRHDDTPEPAEYREQELRDRVAGLGETPEDALDEIASRNESLEERLPDEELSVSGNQAPAGDGGGDSEAPRTEGAPGQG